MTSSILLYVTTAGKDEAERIAKALLEERLIACANIVNAHSLYWWEGKIQQSPEALLLAKTTPSCEQAAIARIKTLHSYTCPGISVIPIVGGLPEFLQWIAAETEKNA